MFVGLSDKLIKIFDKLGGRGLITPEVCDSALREVKVALLEADVALSVVKDFMVRVREKALGQEVAKSIQPAQMMIKIVHDELVDLLGTPRVLEKNTKGLRIILMAGLQGAGKTTTCVKIARYLNQQGDKVVVASLDVYRPAAREQLTEFAQKNEIAAFPITAEKDVMTLTRGAMQYAKDNGFTTLILDTAGRLHIDDTMMQELKDIDALTHPAERILVLDSLTGQDAVRSVQAFCQALTLTGTLLTRIDGDARGGATLSMRMITGVPILFLGTGEKATDLEVFDPKRIADRILGMGDVVGLVEKTMAHIDAQESEKAMMRMMSGKFTLNDMLEQIKKVGAMGDMKGLMLMIPGMAKFRDKIEQADLDNKILKHQEAIILSMTPAERKNPDIIKAARKIRIANGAGLTVNDVNRLLKQYAQMADVVKKFKKMGPFGLMSMMKRATGGKGFFGMSGLPDMTKKGDDQ